MDYRPECGRCRVALADEGPAYFCALECTYCATCYRTLHAVCPTCSGELVRRPRRKRISSDVRAPPAPDPRVRVRNADLDDLPAVVPLFDAYRQFYDQPSDAAAAERFLRERIARNEAAVLLAEGDGRPVGFTQLYPTFSSTSLGRVFVLNDLFVAPSARRKGVGGLLLEAARRWAEQQGAVRLELSTAVDNPAQRLYEAHGWVPDLEYLHYERSTLEDRSNRTAHPAVRGNGPGSSA